MRILHVLTYQGNRGEYGGPASVASELCCELSSRGHAVTLLSGSEESRQNFSNGHLKISVSVRAKIKSIPFASMINFNIVAEIFKQIKKTDLVHIHFSRDLIPIVAGMISIILRKKFFIQTHGMLNRREGPLKRYLDKVIIKRLLKRSAGIYWLNVTEYESLKLFKIEELLRNLPNGIRGATEPRSFVEDPDPIRVVFCSRLSPRKRVDKFLSMIGDANKADDNFIFEIYGPDGGDYWRVQEFLDTNPSLANKLHYGGALSREQVYQLLAEVDVLVLPSDEEPYPMIVIEAMSFGVLPLVMASCHISQLIKECDYRFVHGEGKIIETLRSLEKIVKNIKARENIQKFAAQNFSIEKVVNQLELDYKNNG